MKEIRSVYHDPYLQCSQCGIMRPAHALEDIPVTRKLPDYYDQLDVKRGASQDEVTKAYRARAFEVHPDRNGGSAEAEDRFKRLSAAYAVLNDEESRKEYDAGVQVEVLKLSVTKCKDTEWCQTQCGLKIPADT